MASLEEQIRRINQKTINRANKKADKVGVVRSPVGQRSARVVPGGGQQVTLPNMTAGSDSSINYLNGSGFKSSGYRNPKLQAVARKRKGFIG